jgi:Tfp pilus assembly protein PilF
MRFLKASFALACLIMPTQSFAGDPQWVEVKSPNFSVITDAGEKRGRDVALHFEQMRAAFGTLMTKAHVNLPVPLQIVAFRNSKEMRQMSPLFNGKPTEDAGLFQGGDDRTFIMLDMSVENPWSVVFHEYAHQLMNGNLSVRADPWFEEGFAEYFSSIEVDNKEVRVGKIPEQTYVVLHQMGMMRVADLLRVQQYSKTYNESGDHRNTFYAESGLLVHYIYDNKLVLKLADYFDARITQKKSVEEALQSAFGMTPEQLDKSLRDYLNSNRFRYYPLSSSSIVASEFAIAPVSQADARAVLADIDAHSLDHQDRAQSEFEDVLKADPENAAALRGMGYVYLRKHDLQHASEYFQRAAARDSKDPRVHYYNALLMGQSYGFGKSGKSGEMKKELETAIALDPKLADAYSLLGYAETFSGEPEKGLAAMRKAVELSPRNENYQMNLASIYLANRKPDEAIAVLRSLASNGNPQVAGAAAAALVQAQNFKEQSKAFGPRMEVRPADGAPTSEGLTRGKEAGIPTDAKPTGAQSSDVPPAPTPVKFVKGNLAAVDCSAAPQALLNVIVPGRSLKLHVADSRHVVVFGADEFSCAWKNKKVAINYREHREGMGSGDGDVVSVELQ